MVSDQGVHRSSIRLLFRYEGREVRLVGRKWLTMVPPPSDPVPKQGEREEPRAGFWIDLLDGEGRVLYRQVMGESPIAAAVSVYTGDEEHPFSMQKVAEPRGEFIVVVPDIPEAGSVALFGGPPEAEGFAEASEIARFRLKDSDDGDPR